MKLLSEKEGEREKVFHNVFSEHCSLALERVVNLHCKSIELINPESVINPHCPRVITWVAFGRIGCEFMESIHWRPGGFS